MPTTTVKQLQVIAFYTQNAEEMVCFYTNHLGFDKCDEYPTGNLLKSHDVTIYIEENSDLSSHNRSAVIPTFGTDSIRKSYEDLKSHDIQIQAKYKEWAPGYANFQICDPDGNIIEFAGSP